MSDDIIYGRRSIDREESRLARIEDKIDKLSDAMINLARAEEKLMSMEKGNQLNIDRMNKFSRRIDELESVVNEQGKTVRVMQFVTGIATTIVAGAILKVFFGV